MENRPRGIKHINLAPLEPRNYERYLPTAFNDSLTIVQKVNKVIMYLHEYSRLTDDMLLKWNEVYRWIMNEGLDEAIYDRLNEWYRDGRFQEILERLLLNEYARKDWVENELKEYDEKLSEFEDELNEKLDSFQELISDLLENTLTRKELELTVGSNGDYSTITGAIESIIKMAIYPTKATIKLLNDYVMKEQVIIENIDLSFVTIESNVTIPVEVNTSILSSVKDTEDYPIIWGINSHMPTLDVLFSFSLPKNSSNKWITGLYLYNSRMFMKPNSGFTKFPYNGAMVSFNSSLIANKCYFDDSGNRQELTSPDDAEKNGHGSGIKVRRSNLVANESHANRCGNTGYWIQKSSNAEINLVTANDCGHHTLVTSQGSVCTARNSQLSRAMDNNVVSDSVSVLDISGSTCRDSGNTSIVAQNNSTMYFKNGICSGGDIGANVTTNSDFFGDGANISNNRRIGVAVQKGSRASLRSAIINSNGEDGIRGLTGGIITANIANLNNNGRNGIRCDSSKANIAHAVVKNNDIDIVALRGANISCEGVEVSSTGQTIICNSSSIIQGNNIKGSAKANVSMQTISGNGMILSNNVTKV